MTKVGIIGAGQLGQMLGYAAPRLGVECVFLDPGDHPPAASAGPVMQYDYDSQEGLEKLASMVDVITYEFENVPVSGVRSLRQGPAFIHRLSPWKSRRTGCRKKRCSKNSTSPYRDFTL